MESRYNKVYITIERESEESWKWVYGRKGRGERVPVGYRPHYYLKRTPKRRKMIDDIGKYLWEALGLPDSDGEHRLYVEYDAASLADPSWHPKGRLP